MVVVKQYGFTSKQKILESACFKQIFKQSARVSTPHFALLARPNNRSFARLGISVAKHDVPLASTRSRLKRIFRESFRHYQEVMAGYDVVVCARKSSRTQDNNALRQMVDVQWKKLSTYCSHYSFTASAVTSTQ